MATPASIAKAQQNNKTNGDDAPVDVVPDDAPVDTVPEMSPAVVPDDEVVEGFTRLDGFGRVNTEVPAHADNAQTQITFRDTNGNLHGPMPLADFPQYEKDNLL